MGTLAVLGGIWSQRLINTGYKSYSAVWKHGTIWEKLIFERVSSTWTHRNLTGGDITPPAFFSLDVCPALNSAGDEFSSQTRPKTAHAVGSVGKVKFVARPNNYTGIFQGAKYGIIRLGHTLEPAPGIIDPVFGLALKFLRNSVDSANVVASYKYFNQKSWNLFAENLTNHYEGFGSLKPKLLRHISKASPHPSHVGLSDMARYGEDGKYISNSLLNFPYKLVFKPTGKISFPDEYHGELEDDLDTIEEGTLLWEVYAWDNPAELGGTECLIGSIVLTSPLVRSLYGDTKLFFRHQDMRDDLMLRPEWKEFTVAPGTLFGVQPNCTRNVFNTNVY